MYIMIPTHLKSTVYRIDNRIDNVAVKRDAHIMLNRKNFILLILYIFLAIGDKNTSLFLRFSSMPNMAFCHLQKKSQGTVGVEHIMSKKYMPSLYRKNMLRPNFKSSDITRFSRPLRASGIKALWRSRKDLVRG